MLDATLKNVVPALKRLQKQDRQRVISPFDRWGPGKEICEVSKLMQNAYE